MPGIDVLAEQRDFANAAIGKLFGLRDDLRDRARHFRASRIGHDAEGAELVAAFLHGQERSYASADDLGAAGRRQVLELVLDGVGGLDDLFAVAGPAQAPGSL